MSKESLQKMALIGWLIMMGSLVVVGIKVFTTDYSHSDYFGTIISYFAGAGGGIFLYALIADLIIEIKSATKP